MTECWARVQWCMYVDAMAFVSLRQCSSIIVHQGPIETAYNFDAQLLTNTVHTLLVVFMKGLRLIWVQT